MYEVSTDLIVPKSVLLSAVHLVVVETSAKMPRRLATSLPAMG
jgi:hypothetical protein